jgi:hypothetical protein
VNRVVRGNGGERLPPVDELLAFILRYVQVPSNRAEFRPLDDRQQDFLLLFGLTHRVRRLAQSYLRLRRDKFEVEGQILVRSALEHALSAQWAYLTKGGLQQLRASATRDQYTFVKLLGEYSSEDDIDEIVADYAARVVSGAQLPKMASLIEQLDNNGSSERPTRSCLRSHMSHIKRSSTRSGRMTKGTLRCGLSPIIRPDTRPCTPSHHAASCPPGSLRTLKVPKKKSLAYRSSVGSSACHFDWMLHSP